MERKGVVDYIDLASTTGSNISISNTYILFLTKLQKKANPQKKICPIEKRYHRF